MKIRQFNAKLKTLKSKDGSIKPDHVRALPTVEIAALMSFIVRSRGPVREDFIPCDLDWCWFHAMGYLYVTKAPTGLLWYHTAAHQIT